ncbi:HD domain-containing protein [Sediminispirochaeta smaragdinae]|uniref:5'-deoxynucleotidase n=1 Tax=Sediminispirochaeta smaragdinae (strain DSM 11293 / JCM 15392 / SEBR 4228) TaxID=573413 RepID=E1R9X3_SEDSS|nr:HD domain-containing protein [Sediminispirochaeta smaragdinae]ADK83292.1 metal dependent phosphohydrolase [Sediminispirochaeta smaragdinae DSM 11293]
MNRNFDFVSDKRLEGQLDFIIEIDKLKNIARKSMVFDGSHFENDAEHSWTISVLAILLREYANFNVNIEKVIIMLLIHDIVEVYAGDTFLYSAKRSAAHIEEEKSAEKIFGFLEEDQKEYFLSLWKEFEERKTNEAKFATVFDRLEPLVQNYMTQGGTWKKYNVTYQMVIDKTSHIQEGSKEIWDFVKKLLQVCVERGYLAKEE